MKILIINLQEAIELVNKSIGAIIVLALSVFNIFNGVTEDP